MAPRRMSSRGGDVVKIDLNYIRVWLPNKNDYFHVYQIGQLHPDFLGLVPKMGEWISLADVSNKNNMIAMVYNQNGQTYPRFDSWYMVTAARNLIVAIREQKNSNMNFFDDEVYFRVYTDSYFGSPRSNHISLKTEYKGQVINENTEIIGLQNELIAWRQRLGYAYAMINGYYFEEISPFTAKVGDSVELVYDSSVYRVVEFKAKDLPTFDSVRDNEGKFLLHYALKTNRIDYQDDIDVFLVDRRPSRPNGLYVHKNDPATMRMVTHKDYSLSVANLQAFVTAHPDWTEVDDLSVMLLIRNGGLDRNLVFEKNRIHELYKLPELDILDVMAGPQSVVENWRAETLENSAYSKIMDSKFKDIDRQMVQDAYGYNAISVIAGKTPAIPYNKNGSWGVDVPRGLYTNSTAYEYDENGLLLGWYYHEVGYDYICVHNSCRYVEMISGKVEEWLDEQYDVRTQTLDPKYNYRMYVDDVVSGIPQNKWRDVTGTGMYAVIDNVLTWIVPANRYRTLVRSDKQVYGRIFTRKFEDGVIEFDLIKLRKEQDTFYTMMQDVPLGEYDFLMNGRSLIEGIDYNINFPKVVILNKEFIDQKANEEEQEIVIRAAGFCKEDLTREKPEDVGFIKFELLSRNHVFNIRDDRVLRIVAGGRLYDRTDLKFSETDQAYKLPNAKNGLPYYIRDIVVPMRDLTIGDTYSMREESRVIDKRISDYMSGALPEEVVDVPNVIPERWQVYSPFLSRILFALLADEIPLTAINDRYTMDDVRQMCKPYEYLLAFDPTQTAKAVDLNYVAIHPHYINESVEVDIYHYRFLEMVITLYMNDLRGQITLSKFLHLRNIS